MYDDLKGRSAIVTGATRGIGRAIALTLAAEGVDLTLGYRQADDAAAAVERACRERGVRTVLHRGDVGAPGTAEALVEATTAAFGRLDVVVCNAGVVVESLLATMADEELDALISTNVAGVVRLCRAAQRPMLRQRSGAIVTLSSALASRPGRGHAAYAGTKGFVESFTRALAVELGPKGVRANAVAPGVIDTDMSAAVRAVAADTVTARIALRRVGTPEEVARVVAFLASAESSYLSGAVVGVDGAFLGGV